MVFEVFFLILTENLNLQSNVWAYELVYIKLKLKLILALHNKFAISAIHVILNTSVTYTNCANFKEFAICFEM